MFHVLQAGARAERRPIAAKGLTGLGLRRARVLGHRDLRAAGAHLRAAARGRATRCAGGTRPSPLASERAAQLGLRGRRVPVADDPRARSARATGRPAPPPSTSTPTSPTRSPRYCNATGDDEFERECGLELLVETARLWCSLGHHDAAGGSASTASPGPTSTRAVADNNVYTNLMAQRNLLDAADCGRAPAEAGARRSASTTRRRPRWRDAADAMAIPYDERARRAPAVRGLHRPRALGLRRHAGRRSTRCSCTTRTSTSTASRWSSRPTWCWRMHCRGDAFTAEQKARNFAYYEALTVRDSSLSACTQAVMAAEVGHLDLAYDYSAEAALMDLDDLEHNTRDGVHIASLAGAWIALVAGFGGMRDYGGELTFVAAAARAAHPTAFPASPRARRCSRSRDLQARHLRAASRASEVAIRHHGEVAQGPRRRAGERADPAIRPGPRPRSPTAASRWRPRGSADDADRGRGRRARRRRRAVLDELRGAATSRSPTARWPSRERDDWAWASEAAARDVAEGRAEQAVVCCWTGHRRLDRREQGRRGPRRALRRRGDRRRGAALERRQRARAQPAVDLGGRARRDPRRLVRGRAVRRGRRPRERRAPRRDRVRRRPRDGHRPRTPDSPPAARGRTVHDRRAGRRPRPGPSARATSARTWSPTSPSPSTAHATISGRSGAIGSDADTAMLVGLRTRVDAVMIGAGTMRAERYGRVVGDPGEARSCASARGSPPTRWW